MQRPLWSCCWGPQSQTRLMKRGTISPSNKHKLPLKSKSTSLFVTAEARFSKWYFPCNGCLHMLLTTKSLESLPQWKAWVLVGFTAHQACTLSKCLEVLWLLAHQVNQYGINTMDRHNVLKKNLEDCLVTQGSMEPCSYMRLMKVRA